jgi:predicted HicB family RNase H-like nuclease
METWERYSYRVFWSEEDQEHVGVCAELSGLSWLAKSPESALRGVRRAAREAIDLLGESGDPIPEPLFDRRYSGVFKVRVPPEVHRRLVLEAGEQNVSLNRLVSAKLSLRTETARSDEVREEAQRHGVSVVARGSSRRK